VVPWKEYFGCKKAHLVYAGILFDQIIELQPN
jgi:hypothetical protein